MNVHTDCEFGSNPEQIGAFSFAPFVPPFHYEDTGSQIRDSEDHLVFDCRGWGFLTGRGHAALALPDDKAAAIQAAIGRHVAKLMSASAAQSEIVETLARYLKHPSSDGKQPQRADLRDQLRDLVAALQQAGAES